MAKDEDILGEKRGKRTRLRTSGTCFKLIFIQGPKDKGKEHSIIINKILWQV